MIGEYFAYRFGRSVERSHHHGCCCCHCEPRYTSPRDAAIARMAAFFLLILAIITLLVGIFG
jgi:hypothetical protein